MLPSMLSTFSVRQRSAQPGFLAMPYAGMAMCAGQLGLGGLVSRNLMRDVAMATKAVVLKDGSALRLHHDRLDEQLRRELFAVAPAVFSLGEVLRNEGFGQMAVDADGDPVVARLLPSVVLRLHDVTVHARLGVLLE